MMPDGDRFHMVNGANWFDRTVSADAAGVILTSLVINRQLWLYHDSGDAGLAGLVMTVLTVGLVSCAGKSLPRFWPGDFFPTFYACHLAVLGVLAL
ncbi:putative antirestriction protein [Escherichia coli]|nr:putative antirestriction protein [Escherichia coli]